MENQIDNEYIEDSTTRFLSANRIKALVAGIVLSSALIYFAFVAFQGATVYYFTVGEIKEQPATADGKVVRVSGKLVSESFSRSEGSTLAHFALTDGDSVMTAKHDGVLPDLFFNEHSEIILEGVYIPGHAFQSENVIVKCPSKYVAMEEEKQGS